MAETTDTGGFDRRALIKKGLVAGGIAAAAPMISTFNVPAFAASNGTFGVVFRINASNLGVNRILQGQEPALNLECAPPGFVRNDPGVAELPIDHSATLGLQRQFILNDPDETATCTFTATGARGPDGPPNDCRTVPIDQAGKRATGTGQTGFNAGPVLVFLTVTCT